MVNNTIKVFDVYFYKANNNFLAGNIIIQKIVDCKIFAYFIEDPPGPFFEVFSDELYKDKFDFTEIMEGI